MGNTIAKTFLFFPIALWTMLCGCGLAPSDRAGRETAAERFVPFTLSVCNQSKAVSPIDIRVSIDGEVKIDEEFAVGRQLNWKRFEMTLPVGEHRIEVVSQEGDARLDELFVLAGKQDADLQYWYYPETHRFATPRQFRFSPGTAEAVGETGPIGQR